MACSGIGSGRRRLSTTRLRWSRSADGQSSRGSRASREPSWPDGCSGLKSIPAQLLAGAIWPRSDDWSTTGRVASGEWTKPGGSSPPSFLAPWTRGCPICGAPRQPNPSISHSQGVRSKGALRSLALGLGLLVEPSHVCRLSRDARIDTGGSRLSPRREPLARSFERSFGFEGRPSSVFIGGGTSREPTDL